MKSVRLVHFILGWLLANVLMGAWVWLVLSIERHDYEERALAAARSTVRLVDESITQRTGAVDVALRAVSSDLERMSGARLEGPEVQALLRSRVQWIPEAFAIRVCDERGRVVSSSEGALPGLVNWADRDFFLALRSDPRRGTVVGGVVMGRITHDWVVPFARAWFHPDGRFAGTVVLSMRARHFSELLELAQTGRSGRIELRDQHAALVAGVPDDDPQMGGTGSRQPSADIASLLDGSVPERVFLTRSDGAERIYAYRSLPGAGMHLVASLDGSEFLEGWQGSRRMMIAVAIVFVGATLLAVHQLWLSVSRAQREGQRSQALVRNAGDGVHIVELNGRLVEASDSFGRMLGYATREQVLGLPMGAWDCGLEPAAVGPFLRAQYQTGQRVQFETRHRRRDGSVFEAEVSGVPIRLDGQPVMFYSSRDISGRKADEARRRAAEEQYRHLLDNLPHGVVVHRRGRIIYINREGANLLGARSPDQLIGTRVLERVHPEDIDRVRDRVRVSDANPQASEKVEERAVRLDGSTFHAEVVALPVSMGGEPAVLALFYDVSARHRHDEEMRLASSVYENAGEAILVTDGQNRIIAVNPAFTRLTGYAFDEVQGRNPRMLQSGRHDEDFYRDLWRTLVGTGQWQGEIWNRRKSGEVFAEWATINTVLDEHGEVHRRVCIFSDITERKRAEERIRYQAYYDSLTGLPNRRLLQDRLQQELRAALDAPAPVALMMIDLDRFKEVNDTMGHDIGDLLLVEAAHRIAQCVRESDTVARLGGDEFAVILPRVHEQSRLAQSAHAVITALSRPFQLSGKQVFVSASIGISTFPADARDPGALLMNADHAMYQAKASGRNRFVYFTPSMQREAEERIALTNDLRQALGRGELSVAFQPIVELPSGRIIKAEALLRWRHPRRGLVPPSQFIPLAEETGLIRPIGDWVYVQALGAVRQWHERFGRWIQVSVNQSAVQFADEGDDVMPLGRLDDLGLPGSAIAFEITEGVLIKDAPVVARRLAQYRARGVEVSIDDFGTGFSSLSYLKEFEIDYLKIDRSFVAGLPDDASQRALTEAIVVMAHKLGMRVIAEGVETQAQRDMLVGFGCDLAQGYLWSPALSVTDFDALLAAQADEGPVADAGATPA